MGQTIESKLRLRPALGVLAGGLVLCLTAGGTATAAHLARTAVPAPVVNVTAGKPSEYRFTISPKAVKHGTVVFKITNAGKQAHGFEIDGVSSKVLRPKVTASITVKFKHPGKYVYQCVTTAPPPDFGPGYNDTASQCGGGLLVVK